MTAQEICTIAEECGCGSYPHSNGIFQPPLNLQKYTLRIQAAERERVYEAIDRELEPRVSHAIRDIVKDAIRALGDT